MSDHMVPDRIVLDYGVIDSPLGPLTILAARERVMEVRFGDHRSELEDASLQRKGLAHEHDDPGGAVSALRAYFAGDLHALERLTVDPMGTPFQIRVWNALRSVGVGRTASYTEIANAIGAPTATRAVGAANGANPIAIVVPCHRIIGAAGSLVGYGGGLDRKRWLLEHEGVLLKM
jgi:methylated-DNA-[protein]-cysteine S-methyltransferase